MEQHLANAGLDRYRHEDFCRAVWWAGDLNWCPNSGPLWVARANRGVVVAMFPIPPAEIPPIVVVTGVESSPSPNDGAGVFYMIEEFELGRRVFATSEEHLPHWAVAYAIDRDRWAGHTGPAVVEAGLTGVYGLAEEVLVLDQARYHELLVEALP